MRKRFIGRKCHERSRRREQELAGEPSDLEADLIPMKAEREGRLNRKSLRL